MTSDCSNSDSSNNDISNSYSSNSDSSNSHNSDSDSSESSNSDIIYQKQCDTLTTDEMFSGQRFAILAMFFFKAIQNQDSDSDSESDSDTVTQSHCPLDADINNYNLYNGTLDI